MSDRDLIQYARNGDAAAIRVLYDRHSSRVLAVVSRLAPDRESAEDWAQDTWIRALRGLPSFRDDAAFSTWVHRIAVNCALAGRRRWRRREDREIAVEGTADFAGRGERPLLRLDLERALATLPPRMRQVLVLHDVEGFTHEEIGELLCVEAGTSKSQLFRARAKMRQILAPVHAAA
jgi:RNA polymerase sigma-70 factor, ECF subfamily